MLRIAGPVAVGLLGMWPSDGWACGRGLLRMWPSDCCANVRRIAGPVNVGLLEARSGFGLSTAKLPKTLQTRLRKFLHRNRRCEDVQQTLQPEEVKQTPMSALKCHHQLISSVVRGRFEALVNANR